jgi:hypothetical protein
MNLTNSQKVLRNLAVAALSVLVTSSSRLTAASAPTLTLIDASTGLNKALPSVPNKSEGDKVESGEAIMVVESDKADMDVEAFEDGYIAAIITEEGESALVGTPVALIAANEADIPALKSYASTLGGAAPVAAAATPQAAAPSPKATPKAVAPVSSGSTGDRVVASPLAKKMAQEMGVDISSVVGTGPGGSEFVMENVSVMLLLCTKYHSCIYL